jgi:hypothetical protein
MEIAWGVGIVADFLRTTFSSLSALESVPRQRFSPWIVNRSELIVERSTENIVLNGISRYGIFVYGHAKAGHG